MSPYEFLDGSDMDLAHAAEEIERWRRAAEVNIEENVILRGNLQDVERTLHGKAEALYMQSNRIAELEARVKELEDCTVSPGTLLMLRAEIRLLREQLTAHQSTLKVSVEALENIATTEYHIERPPVESLEMKMRNTANKALAKIKEIVK